MPNIHAPQVALSVYPDVKPQERSSSYHLPQDVAERFGHRLKALRRERNMTQLEMAKNFGLDRSFIIDIECGRKSASLRTLEIIAIGMKISLSELLRHL